MASNRTDHHASADDALLLGLADADALAFAEACSRTLTAAHAVVRRLVPAGDVEGILRRVYARLWSDPPSEGPLEGWTRRQCFEAAVAMLRDRGHAPAVPSAHLAVPDLPAPPERFLDTVEHAVAELDEDERRALVRAHDAGRPAVGPRAPREGAAATRALLALAESDRRVAVADPRAADWVLGLLPAGEAAEVAAAVGGPDGEAARALRRGRRRLEGLPPGADLAARLVAATLADSAPAPPAQVPEHDAVEPEHEAAEPEHDAVEPEHDAAEPEHDAVEAVVLDPSLEAEARIEVGGDPVEVGGEPGDSAYAALLDDDDRADDEDDDGLVDGAWGEPAEPERRRRGGLVALGWLLATVAAVGVGMLVGRMLLEAGVIR